MIVFYKISPTLKNNHNTQRRFKADRRLKKIKKVTKNNKKFLEALGFQV